MPLRGIADDARRIVALTADGTVTLQTHQDQDVDPAALAGVLAHPRSEAWTGVLFAAPESFEWLDLWLACVMGNALSRMPVQRPAVDSGLVAPMFGWGAMATAEKGTLAYLTLRPAPKASDGTSMNEVGVIAHGPGSDELAERIVREIRAFDRDYRSRTAQIEIQPADASKPITGQFTFRTRATSSPSHGNEHSHPQPYSTALSAGSTPPARMPAAQPANRAGPGTRAR